MNYHASFVFLAFCGSVFWICAVGLLGVSLWESYQEVINWVVGVVAGVVVIACMVCTVLYFLGVI